MKPTRRFFTALLLLCFSGISVGAANRVSYFGYHVSNDTIYAVFRITGNEILGYPFDVWHYTVNDTVWSDTGGYVITAIDTAANRVTLDTLSNNSTGKTRVSELVGLISDSSTIILDGSIIRITAITKASVSLRLFKVPHEKKYAGDDDTVTISGSSLSGIHTVENELIMEECRELIIPDTSIDNVLWCFFFNRICDEKISRYRITPSGINLMISLMHDYSAMVLMDTVTFIGDIDSTDIIVNLGETATVPYDGTAITPVWLMNEDYSIYARAAGFRLVEGNDVTVDRSSPSLKSGAKVLPGKSGSAAVVNLLGRDMRNEMKFQKKRINIVKGISEGKRLILR